MWTIQLLKNKFLNDSNDHTFCILWARFTASTSHSPSVIPDERTLSPTPGLTTEDPAFVIILDSSSFIECSSSLILLQRDLCALTRSLKIKIKRNREIIIGLLATKRNVIFSFAEHSNNKKTY